jgi:hypothetical protein
VSVEELINEVKARGYKLSVKRGILAIRGPKEHLADVTEQLRPHRDAVIAHLSRKRKSDFIADRFADSLNLIEATMRAALENPASKFYQNETWPTRPALEHVAHARAHLDNWLSGDQIEDHLGHAATRLLMALQNVLDGDAQPAPGAIAPLTCWRCGADPSGPPSLDEQVEILRFEHEKRGGLHAWSDREWQRLRQMLQPGDILAVVKGSLGGPPLQVMYATVAVHRGGNLVMIERKALMDA